VNGSGLVFNPPRSTAPFLSATIVLSTILHRCSTSHPRRGAILLDFRVGTLLEEGKTDRCLSSVFLPVCKGNGKYSSKYSRLY